MRPGSTQPGEIVDKSGEVLGRHNGIINFTVGQRRGLNIGGGNPLYVLRLEPHSNRVIVGAQTDLLKTKITLKDINWLGDKPLGDKPILVDVKLRSMTPLLPATVQSSADQIAEVSLQHGYAGVSPGQACVFYVGERVLGGGWIIEAE